MRIPVWFEGSITAEEVKRIFTGSGYIVKTEGIGHNARLVVSRVPEFLRTAMPRSLAAVVPLPRPGIRKRRTG